MSEIKLINLDCTKAMREMPDKAFGLAIVDPPYAHNSGNAFTSRLKRYGDLSFNDKQPDPIYFSELIRVSTNQIIWGGNYFISMLQSTKCLITWDKHQPVPTYARTEIAWTSFQDRHSDLFDYPYFGNINSDLFRIHPNQKPVKLYEWLLTNYAKPGDKILDTHGGSMSIAIACHNLGFDLTLYEIDKEYFEAGKKRLENHQKQLMMFV